ncbi:MAG: MurR/RpiR family transcriptional regulator [Pseudomonadota bacterium]
MNNTIVPNSPDSKPDSVLGELATQLESLTPEVRKAAAYVLENPMDVGVSSIREIADAANVKPNTFVRMAREVGFEGYEDFRAPFRHAIRNGTASFPDRARWLQSIRQGGQLGELYADMVSSTLSNIETTFAGIDEKTLKSAAEAIWNSRQTFTLGVGVNSANAQNFTYLASTGMVQFHAIPKSGSTAVDDLAWADERDVLIAITCKPYRREVVEAMQVAREQGLRIVGISDSPASPIITGSEFGFVVSADTPQFFPSSVSTIALLETLLSFVIASASPEIVDRVDRFHKRRHELGIYEKEL